jgi:hypothetical protein
MNHVSKTSFFAITAVCALLAGCAQEPLADSEIDNTPGGEDEVLGEAASNLVSGPSMILHAPGGNTAQAFPADYMAYLTWDGTQWCARIYGSTFLHAPGCNWAAAHSDDHIAYKATDGSNWTAKVASGGFSHALNGDWSQALQSPVLSYNDWNGAPFHMRVMRALEHTPVGGGQPSPEPYMCYRAWNGTPFCASVYGDVFLHAAFGDWAQMFVADYIAYKRPDGSNWSSKVTPSGFLHAPGGDWSQAHESPLLSYREWNQDGWNVRFPREPELIAKPGRNFTLNLHGNVHGDGAIVNLWEKNGHASQTWTFGADARIHPAGDTRFCLAHWGDANTPANGSAAVLWSCVDHNSQRWTAWPDGTIRKASNSNKCLNLDSNAYENGHIVDVYDCNGHESQQWAGPAWVQETLCTDPRPQFCLQDYAPVCGRDASGSTSTYSNACDACMCTSVVAWTEGTCSSEI